MTAALRLVQPGVPLPQADTADLPEQLRQIAFDIESGLMVGAHTAVVIVDAPGRELMVYGLSAGDAALRLNAAHMLLALAQRELERVALEIRAS